MIKKLIRISIILILGIILGIGIRSIKASTLTPQPSTTLQRVALKQLKQNPQLTGLTAMRTGLDRLDLQLLSAKTLNGSLWLAVSQRLLPLHGLTRNLELGLNLNAELSPVK